jgi:hypothetical protein
MIKYPSKLCDHLQIALHVDETAQTIDGLARLDEATGVSGPITELGN